MAYESLMANETASRYPDLGSGQEKSFGSYVISTTHYYYRFLPQDSSQYEQLLADEILAVSDTPFELEGQDNGVNYVDPSIASTGSPFTYYYSVVPVGYALPNGIQAEHLADLHFTPEDEIGAEPTPAELEALDFYYNLNLEALKISGQLPEEERRELRYMTSSNPNPLQSMSYEEVIRDKIPFDQVLIVFSDIDVAKSRRLWPPSGSITVEEDVLSSIQGSMRMVGVRNAHVKVRKWGWLVIQHAETTKTGAFVTSATRTQRVKYAVYFQPRDKRFTVKAGTIFTDARHRGTNSYERGQWLQSFPLASDEHRSHFYALVHNAAADYTFDWVEHPDFMLTRPWWGIRISAKFNSTSSNYLGFLNSSIVPLGGSVPVFLSEIRVSRYNGDEKNRIYKGSDGIYATTTHELAHAGHFAMDRLMFLGFSGLFDVKQRDLMIESWAEGVETIVTNHRYDAIAPGSNIDYNSFRQELGVGSQGSPNAISKYTPLFIDLNDRINQNTIFANFIPRPPVDRVSDYTISQMQTSLKTSRTLVQLENRLRVNHDNPTEENLAELFIYPLEVLATLQD
ncbi:hypothetical protein QWY85_13355 [Neolewinella lacunae]|uniref:Uncharacterized protein n=1 Tax=Neolewinella lacunae TaxID=1517758 RepID=A0A923PNE1_9BACT|nr:hypothetical protein [Neolewinella lacunae]MBC6995615.1 hypothetical protein [Neolewinella lacunae]MDN3635651.1 hypothetical protein [Neolewinella lacunae]